MGNLLDSETIRHLWVQTLNGDSALANSLTAAIADTLTALDEKEGAPPTEGFGLAIRNWAIDLREVTVRAVVMSALIAAGLAQTGLVTVGIAILTAVVPSVLEIERIELDAGDRLVAINLRVKADVREGGLTEEVLYAQLSDEIRGTVSRVELARIVQRLRRAGVATPGDDERIILQDPDDRRPLFRFRQLGKPSGNLSQPPEGQVAVDGGSVTLKVSAVVGRSNWPSSYITRA